MSINKTSVSSIVIGLFAVVVFIIYINAGMSAEKMKIEQGKIFDIFKSNLIWHNGEIYKVSQIKYNKIHVVKNNKIHEFCTGEIVPVRIIKNN